MIIVRFVRIIWALLKDPAARGGVYFALGALAVGMLFYHFVEGWSLLDSLYFSLITLATVGYGDFTPKTAPGKIFTMIYILIGLSILAGFVSLIAAKHRDMQALERRANQPAPAEPESIDAPKD